MKLVLFFVLLAVPSWGAWGTATGACTAQSKTAGVDLDCIPTVAFTAGNVAILWAAMDNVATTDQNSNDCTSVIDTTGNNTWVKLREFTNAQGAGAAGATTCIFYSILTTGVGTGDAIRFTHTSVTARAISVIEFTIGAGNTVSIVGTPVDLANDAADPGSMTVGSLASAEHLWIRSIALERANASCTATSGGLFATIPNNGTTGGGAASNMNVCGEWDVATATTNTSDPGATAVDNASIFLALDEGTPAATTGVGWYGKSGYF